MKRTVVKARPSKSIARHPIRGRIGGTYTFRFGGFARGPDERPYHIVGVGQLKLTAGGKLVGAHRSTIAALSGKGPATLQHSIYALTGDYAVRSDGSATTTVFFHRGGDPNVPPNLMDRFEIVMAGGPDRLWFVSTGPQLWPSGAPVDELVSVEVIRSPH